MFLIPLFITFLNAKVLGFFSYEQNLILGSEMCKIQLQEIVGNLLDKPSKIIHGVAQSSKFFSSFQ